MSQFQSRATSRTKEYPRSFKKDGKWKSSLKGSTKLRMTLQRMDREISAEVREVLEQEVRAIQKGTIANAKAMGLPDRLIEAYGSKFAIGKASNGFKWIFGIRTKKLKKLAFDAHFIELGTKGGVRVAIRGKTKLFFGRVKAINHPGTRARPHMFPVVTARRAEFRKNLDRAIDRAMRRAATQRRAGRFADLMGDRSASGVSGRLADVMDR